MAGLWDTAAFGIGSPAETAEKAPNLWDRLFGGAVNSLATLPRRAIENSQTSLDTGNYNPAPAVEAAMLPMGTGAVAGVPVRAGEAVLGAGPIRAYHGSPHDFDAFDLSKIGTGEGAQAYGHGLYFAENEATAKSYRDALTQPVQTAGNAHVQNIGGKYHVVDDFGVQAGPFDTKEAAAASMSKQPGKIYEVNINADPAHFLDWDKPLSGQSEHVQDALSAVGYQPSDPRLAATGGGVYNDLRRVFRDPNLDWSNRQAAARALEGKSSEGLREAGIPGIRYLDQGSRIHGNPTLIQSALDEAIGNLAKARSNGIPEQIAMHERNVANHEQMLKNSTQGTSNYVVFNPNIIDIMRKYGIALPGGAAAADVYTRSQEPQL